MISEWLRDHTYPLINPIARQISRLGISPNWITGLGLMANVVVALLIMRGYLRLGGALTLLASLFDTFDGALARASGRASSFGAFLDSILDRFSEAVLYLGLLLHYAQGGQHMEVTLIYATIVGSLMVSYVRARAEGLGLQCKVGLLTRAERMGLLVVGLLAGIMPWMLWALAVLTHVTAAQRVYHVWRLTHRDSAPA
ncbi:MAG: CDP-alcohol phosphatidyltransferase family protein [Chloroflexota bacterium]|nr:CDP-alcohol phosphatidyltransferase family protein [Chloroflexota bacterium]